MKQQTRYLIAALAALSMAAGAVHATDINKTKSNVKNNREAAAPGAPAAAVKTYPPHGYPCLGCHPCPPDYCDNDNNAIVVKGGAPGAGVKQTK